MAKLTVDTDTIVTLKIVMTDTECGDLITELADTIDVVVNNEKLPYWPNKLIELRDVLEAAD